MFSTISRYLAFVKEARQRVLFGHCAFFRMPHFMVDPASLDSTEVNNFVLALAHLLKYHSCFDKGSSDHLPIAFKNISTRLTPTAVPNSHLPLDHPYYYDFSELSQRTATSSAVAEIQVIGSLIRGSIGKLVEGHYFNGQAQLCGPPGPFNEDLSCVACWAYHKWQQLSFEPWPDRRDWENPPLFGGIGRPCVVWKFLHEQTGIWYELDRAASAELYRQSLIERFITLVEVGKFCRQTSSRIVSSFSPLGMRLRACLDRFVLVQEASTQHYGSLVLWSTYDKSSIKKALENLSSIDLASKGSHEPREAYS